MNMNGGYLKLFRKIPEWRWYKNQNVKSLFIHCLVRANWEDTRFENIMICRGQFMTSYQNLSLETGLSVHQVRTAIDKLIGDEITVKTANKYTIITVLNYSTYQGEDLVNGNQMANKWQSNGNQMATSNNIKNIKKNKNTNNKLLVYLSSEDEINNFENITKYKFILNNSKFAFITQQLYDDFKRLYPAFNLDTELLKIESWCLTNISKRKTESGALTFLNSWLARVQNKPDYQISKNGHDTNGHTHITEESVKSQIKRIFGKDV